MLCLERELSLLIKIQFRKIDTKTDSKSDIKTGRPDIKMDKTEKMRPFPQFSKANWNSDTEETEIVTAYNCPVLIFCFLY
jgi:hypothetical protein